MAQSTEKLPENISLNAEGQQEFNQKVKEIKKKV